MQQPGDQKPNGQRAAKNENPAEEASRKFAISARYIRQLFSDEGTSISDYVTAQRLACVHSCLTDRRQKLRRIADIAQASRPIATVTEKLQRRRE